MPIKAISLHELQLFLAAKTLHELALSQVLQMNVEMRDL